MDDSGELEILERQVSLLQDLLGNLERRRQARHRAEESSPKVPRKLPPVAPSNLAEERAKLHLVQPEPESPEPAATPGESSRRPHFREHRRWDLSSSVPSQGEVEASTTAPTPGREPPGPVQPGSISVPWDAYQQLLGQHDDLLLQLSHHQAAEARLMEERVAGERKDAEIRELRDQLRGQESSGLRDLLGHLHRRVRVAEEFEGQLIERAIGPAPDSVAAEPNRTTLLALRGYQLEVTTAREPGRTTYAFGVLTDVSCSPRKRKGFHALAASEREAELACIERALCYLDEVGSPPGEESGGASREILEIRGNKVELLVDAAEDGGYRAFPFLHIGGARRILLRFHLEEPIIESTVSEVRQRCITRLEEELNSSRARS